MVFKRRDHASGVSGFYDTSRDWDSVSGSQARNGLDAFPVRRSTHSSGALTRLHQNPRQVSNNQRSFPAISLHSFTATTTIAGLVRGSELCLGYERWTRERQHKDEKRS